MEGLMNYTDTKNELAFLSGLIGNPGLINKTKIETKHFLDLRNARIFENISELIDSNTKPEWSMISGRINDSAIDDHIMSIIASDPTDTYINMAKSIIKAHTGRCIDSLCNSILEKNKASDNTNKTLMQAIDDFGLIANETTDKAEILTSSIAKTMDILKQPKKHQTLIKTGIDSLDNMTGGIPSGMLTVIGADTSMGKSTFIINLIMNMAMNNKKVLFISIEDPAHFVNLRILSRYSGVDSMKLSQHKELSLEEFQALEETQKRLLSDNVTIDDSTGQTIDRIRRTAMRLKAKGMLDILFLDHISELSNQFDMTASTSNNVRLLRDLSRELDIPIVVASQLNRDIKHQKDSVPTLANIKNSSTIGEMARCIWLLYRPFRYNANASPNELQVIVAKSTHGIIGTNKLNIELNKMKVSDEPIQARCIYD
jgi:replicative DNA helicase